MLAFLNNYRLTDVDLFKICYPWSVLDLHVEEIHVLPVNQVFFIIYDPHATQKRRMYSGYCFFCLSLHTGCLPRQ